MDSDDLKQILNMKQIQLGTLFDVLTSKPEIQRSDWDYLLHLLTYCTGLLDVCEHPDLVEYSSYTGLAEWSQVQMVPWNLHCLSKNSWV